MIGFYDYTVIATYLATVLGVCGCFMAVDGQILGAVFCLLLSGLLDTFDGRIARTKKDRTENGKRFGIQIDSLNDLVCFGLLPAVIGHELYRSWTDGAKVPAWFTAVLCYFVLAGLIRLAYFNVLEEERQQSESGSRKYYLGMPITSSTLGFPLFYLLTLLVEAAVAKIALLTFGFLLMATLYISPIHVPKPGLKSIAVMSALAAAILFGLFKLAM